MNGRMMGNWHPIKQILISEKCNEVLSVLPVG